MVWSGTHTGSNSHLDHSYLVLHVSVPVLWSNSWSRYLVSRMVSSCRCIAPKSGWFEDHGLKFMVWILVWGVMKILLVEIIQVDQVRLIVRYISFDIYLVTLMCSAVYIFVYIHFGHFWLVVRVYLTTSGPFEVVSDAYISFGHLGLVARYIWVDLITLDWYWGIYLGWYIVGSFGLVMSNIYMISYIIGHFW